jgi:hypothetical protein
MEDLLYKKDDSVEKLLVSASMCEVQPEHDVYKEEMISQASKNLHELGVELNLQNVILG